MAVAVCAFVQVEELQQFLGRAALAKHVVDGNHLHRARHVQGQDLGDAVAEATIALVFFSRDHTMGLTHRI